jgi:ABC-type nitrate/sulfonate/bicarbonate transport system substrate-binding protein
MDWTEFTGRRRVTLSLAAVLSGLIILGSAAGGAASSTRQHGASAEDTLHLAFPGYATTTMLTYIATANGYFKHLGLAIYLSDGVGANTTALLVSGRADIVSYGSTSPLSLANQGKQTSTIYADNGGGNSGFMIGNNSSAPTLAALESLKSCVIATFAVGSPPYGYTVQYEHELGINCRIIPFSSVPSMIAALVAGSADAAVLSFSTFASTLAAGEAKVLIDTRIPSVRQKYVGGNFIESTEVGLPANLKAKRSAVIKWLKGENLARKWLKTHTDKQAAALLGKFGKFGSDTLLIQKVAAQRAYMNAGNTNGYITAGQWNYSLQRFSAFDLPNYSPSNPAYSYGNLVDMSYYDAAIGKPRGG